MFWRITIGAGVLVLLIVGALLVRRASASRPSLEVNDARTKEVSETRTAQEEGRRLYDAGRYQESLALFRQVLEKDPNSRPAREGVQKAEAALQGKQDEAKKTEEVDRTLQAAKEAYDQGNYEEARKQAEAVLALDANRAEAQKVRDDSAAKIAEAEAAKKKASKPAVAAVKRPTAIVARKTGETPPTP